MPLEMKYFVLKPKGTDRYAKASRAAMRTYADILQMYCREEDGELAQQLRDWVTREEMADRESRQIAARAAGVK